VGAQARVDGVDYGGDEAELRKSGGEVWQHEVADSEGGETCDGGCAVLGREHEEEDLADVVVALEVAEVGVATEDFDYEI
jgi:hypothetical protein